MLILKKRSGVNLHFKLNTDETKVRGDVKTVAVGGLSKTGLEMFLPFFFERG